MTNEAGTSDTSGITDGGCLALGAGCDPANNLCCSGFCANLGRGGPICAQPLTDGGVSSDASADAGVDPPDAAADAPAPDQALDTTVDVGPDTTVDSTVDVGPDTAVDSTVDVGPDSTVDSTADMGPDTTVDSTVDVGPDTTVDSTVDVGPDTTVDSTVDVGPDTTVDSTVDVGPDTTVDSTVDVGPDTTVDSTVDVGPDTTVDSTVDVGPDTTVDSTVDVVSPFDLTVDTTVDTLPPDLYPSKPVECFDGIDNDGDGKIDSDDPECTGALDDSEAHFGNAIPGDNVDCKEDCFFDGDSGSGNDNCFWDITCDDLDPRAPKCTFNGTLNPLTDPTCVSTPDTCLDFCQPISPNGCDCFGCCEMPVTDPDTLITTQEFIKLSDTCNASNLTDTDACRRCLQVPACLNPCEHCELCIGKTELP
ncbi:MAG: hypothetical protein JRH20_26255, partial [Deltaproteobacteria bacterium]|nr:hypothetical protein [Deltaproteobacteria bacterium]